MGLGEKAGEGGYAVWGGGGIGLMWGDAEWRIWDELIKLENPWFGEDVLRRENGALETTGRDNFLIETLMS